MSGPKMEILSRFLTVNCTDPKQFLLQIHRKRLFHSQIEHHDRIYRAFRIFHSLCSFLCLLLLPFKAYSNGWDEQV